ncbi:tocopherol cyclase family protein [Lacticigenium naphthae]|uniref:tocopherol cyclase family protein n=1 Tax=Lacticigenium naphthae TaxID=515351 RepID=UPI00042751FC|nr:tocopherol cyclase family protein [Lacticigenium naphthae]
MFEKVKNPIVFQGKGKKKNYFEGWYYKQVTADQKTTLSLIPGISLTKQDPHSFVQYIVVHTDEKGHKQTKTGFKRYAVEEFVAVESPFGVQIGGNIFTQKFIQVDLKDEQVDIKGQLQFGEWTPIETTASQPTIMGPFSYLPKMECYHGILSMNHSLKGNMRIFEEAISFDGGKGYVEKDWGTSFPKEYVWIQSNHFADPTMSLFFSEAHIPFHFTSFYGFICNFRHEGKEYRFATYTDSSIEKVTGTEQEVTYILENSRARLEIYARQTEAGELIAPVIGEMNQVIKEGLSGVVEIIFTDKEKGTAIHDLSASAGIEIVKRES